MQKISKIPTLFRTVCTHIFIVPAKTIDSLFDYFGHDFYGNKTKFEQVISSNINAKLRGGDHFCIVYNSSPLRDDYLGVSTGDHWTNLQWFALQTQPDADQWIIDNASSTSITNNNE